LKNTYATLFGISIADADKYVGYAAFYAFLIGLLSDLRTFTQDVTKYKNTFFIAPLNTANGALPGYTITPPAAIPTEAGVFTIISGVIKTIKAHPKYTTAIGEDLGIIGDEVSFDADNYKPTGKAISMPGEVKIDFTKLGVDAEHVYSNPVGGTDPNEWVLLATDAHTPYNDSRPLAVPGKPETRRYRLRGVMGDAEIGQFSDIITVTFAG
jgi:hypothetical protein